MNSPAPAPGPSRKQASRKALRDQAQEIMDRWAGGDEPDAVSALARHPELLADQSLVVDLAYEEFCLREEAGEAPDPETFCARFPACRTSLRRTLEVHHGLGENPQAPAKAFPAGWPQAGDKVGEFTLVRELGRGAFARVFLATEATTGDRPVALKLTRGGAAEARTLGRLVHPNVVPIHSACKDPATGLTLVCMPFLGGATLLDVLDRAFPGEGSPPPSRAAIILDAVGATASPDDPAIPVDRRDPVWEFGSYADGCLHLGAQFADALAFLHGQHVCHRDLKPSNVLLRPDGRPLLLDFNLSDAGEAGTGRRGGTIPYMAPEQIQAWEAGPSGKTAVDERADLFALGVILYELLTGRHPFGPIPAGLPAKELRRLLLQRQRGGLAPLRALAPRVPRAAAGLIEQCLAYKPARRPAGAAAVAAGLRRCFWPFRLRCGIARWSRPVLTAGCLLALAAGVGGWGWSLRAPSNSREYLAGRAAFQAGRLEEAERHFGRALEADPQHRGSRFARACAWLREADGLQGQAARDKFKDALHEFEQLAAREPRDGVLLACMGFCHSGGGDPPRAIVLYEQALAAGYDSAGLFNNQALGYLNCNDLERAEQSLREALKRDKALQAAYYNRAMLAYQRWLQAPSVPFPEAALADIDKAVRLGPHTDQLLADAGALYAAAAQPRHDGRAKQAIAHLSRAVAMGQEPARLTANPLVAQLDWHPDFPGLMAKQRGPVSRAQILRLVNPVVTLPD
jgi:serine/threonine protein kinase/Tfp pilus assembly protein PilF